MFKLSLNRRRFFYIGLSGLASGTAAIVGKNNSLMYISQALDNPKRDFKVFGSASLKQRAQKKGLIYGAATTRDYLDKDANFAASFQKDCGILVPENELKWGSIRPAPNQFNFTQADWLVKFAIRNNMLFRGHTLVWHEQLPQWFKEVVNRQNAEKFLVEHITTVAKRYTGVMHSWDVVNEAIDAEDSRNASWRRSPWFEFLGSDYIELAYRVTAQSDPKSMLVYNENELEYDTPKSEAKRTAVLKLLERLKSKGTPIHALGIQSHLLGHDIPFSSKKLSNFLAHIASLGLKILITELDVTDNKLLLDSAAIDRVVASRYEDYLSVVLSEQAVIAVLTWGLSDKYTWLSMFNQRKDLAPVRPLPLDSNFKRKLAWNAMARAFDQAPKR